MGWGKGPGTPDSSPRAHYTSWLWLCFTMVCVPQSFRKGEVVTLILGCQLRWPNHFLRLDLIGGAAFGSGPS